MLNWSFHFQNKVLDLVKFCTQIEKFCVTDKLYFGYNLKTASMPIAVAYEYDKNF